MKNYRAYHLVVAAIYMVKCAQDGQDFRCLPSDACEPSRDQICKFWDTNTLSKFYRKVPGNTMVQIKRVRTADIHCQFCYGNATTFLVVWVEYGRAISFVRLYFCCFSLFLLDGKRHFTKIYNTGYPQNNFDI